MPWHLENRDGKVCVIKDSDGSVAGCHDSRADAIKQQRALYANESRMASMYEELDALEITPAEEEEIAQIPVERHVTPTGELVKIEIGKEQDALIASLAERMDEMSRQQAETQLALVAALQAIGARESVVNVAAPEVSVEAPHVTIEPPTIDVHVPEQTVEVRPEIKFEPEIHLPAVQKTVTFERDPLTREVTKAEVTEA